MPAQAAVSSLVLAGSLSNPFGIAAAFLLAGSIDAFLLGSIFGPDDIKTDLGKQNLNIRSSSESHKIVYGRTMLGGTVVFLDVLDRYYLEVKSNKACPPVLKEQRDAGDYLNMAVAVAAHEIDAIEEVWIGEDKVFDTDPITGEFRLIKDKYKKFIYFEAFDGSQTSHSTFIKANVDKHYDAKNASDATNVAYYTPDGVTGATSTTLTIDTNKIYKSENTKTYHYSYWTGGNNGSYAICDGTIGAPGGAVETFQKTNKNPRAEPDNGRPWNSSYKLTNTAYAYFRFRFNPDLYNGIPKTRLVVRGKKVYDPRWDTNYLTTVNKNTWVQNTSYSVNDRVTVGGKWWICQIAHISVNTAWGDSAFNTDWVINRYWKTRNFADDPSTWEWSDNWALCVRDYLTSGNYHAVLAGSYSLPINLYGIGVKTTEIDEENVIEAANVSDELVYLRDSAETVETDSYSSTTHKQTITVDGDITDYYVPYEIIEITTAVANASKATNRITSYILWLIAQLANLASPPYNLATSLYHIETSVYDSGTGKTTITFAAAQDLSPTAIRLYSPRFSANGIADTANSPISILENLLASGSGKLPYAQGKFLIIPGVYITPTIHIDESNLAGGIVVNGSLPTSELINTVTGTIKNPAAYWEETNFPKQTAQAYIDADGGYELIQNVKYPFTTSNFDAERLARITLQRSREGVSCTLTCNLSVMEIMVGAFITVSIDRLGWVNKVFSVSSWTYQDGKISLGLREENSVAYDWTPGQLTPIPYSPNTNFEVAPDLDPVTDLTLVSGTAQLIALADGTIVPRVLVTWTAPEQDVQTYLELTYQLKPFNINDDVVTDRTIRLPDPEIEEYYIDEVREGDVIDLSVVIRYDDPNIIATSTVVNVTNHTVVGHTEPPADVTGFSSVISEDHLILSWDANTEIDFSHFEIREGASWAAGTVLDTTSSTTYIVTEVVIGSLNFWIKALDNTDNESTNAANTSPSIVGPNAVADVIDTINENTVTLSWAAAVQGTFAISHYEIRYDPGNILVGAVDATEFNISVNWLGTRTYKVISVDIYGNQSNATSEGVTLAAPNAPSINPYILNADKVEFTWTIAINSDTQFPIKAYEIAHGNFQSGTNDTADSTGITLEDSGAFFQDNVLVGDMVTNTTDGSSGIIQSISSQTVLILKGSGLEGGTDNQWDLTDNYIVSRFILTTGTDGFSRRVDWLTSNEATRTFRLRAVDQVGNAGPISTVGVSVSVPKSFSVNKQVIDNNVLLTWNEPVITPNVNLPIAHYEIRKGDVYGTSEHIGDLSGLFAAIFETVAGTFTYWITAHDTAGNPGPNNSITASVNQPPDYTLLVNASDDFVTDDVNWGSRLFTNAFKTNAGTVAIPIDTTETWTDHFVQTPTGTGTVTTPDATGVTLTDSVAAFQTTAAIGQVVHNITDSSTGIITSITNDQNVVMSGGLSGGSDNQWDSSDSYELSEWQDIQDQQNAGFPIYAQPTPASGSYQVVYDLGTIVSNLAVTLDVTAIIIAGDPEATLKIETAEYNVVPAGTVTTPDATGITLTDTSGTFETETSVGSLVTNTTTGDTGIITEIISDTVLKTGGGLTGAGDNEWGSGDAYTIENWIERGTTTTSALTAFVTSFRYVRVTIDVASSVNDDDLWDMSALNIIVDVKEITDAGTQAIAPITGTNTTLDTLGETLTTSGESLLTDAIVGQTIRNTTDGSTGIIESITNNDELVLVSPGLSGGSDNQWQVNDDFSLGTTVFFTKSFIDINSLTVTPSGGVSLVGVYDFADVPNPLRFSVYVFDDAGVEVLTGDFSWLARGY
jgi:hypothetical protein